MEWLTYFMIMLIAFATCLDCPVLTNSEDSDGPANSIGAGSGRNVPFNSDPPDMIKEKDPPGGGAGPDSTHCRK